MLFSGAIVAHFLATELASSWESGLVGRCEKWAAEETLAEFPSANHTTTKKKVWGWPSFPGTENKSQNFPPNMEKRRYFKIFIYQPISRFSWPWAVRNPLFLVATTVVVANQLKKKHHLQQGPAESKLIKGFAGCVAQISFPIEAKINTDGSLSYEWQTCLGVKRRKEHISH